MTIKIRTADRAVGETSKLQRSAVAAAALMVAGSLFSSPASALTLGGMTVQSNLGEALRAEVQVSDLAPAEAASLTVQPGTPAAFRTAGVEYNAALVGMQVAIERRGNGQAVLRLTGNRQVNEPFIDVLLEASWAGGRLSRTYTVLLDPPPATPRSAAPAPLAPQLPPAPRPQASASPTPAIVPPALVPVPTPAVPRTVRPAPAPAAPRAAPPAPSTASAGTLTVRPGDTAGAIAGRRKAASVSLDQMLVAMLQANPDAFINGNVNRLRAGAVLDMPSPSDAAAIPAGEARQTIVAQSRDFNEFRRRLAAGAPAVAAAAPQREARGSVQTQVEDRRPAATTPDRLTLSKGSVAAPAAAEAERIARANQERDSAQRLAELSRNVDELNRLGATSGSTATAKPPAAPAPAPIPAPIPAPTPAPAPAPVPAPAPAPAEPPVATSSPEATTPPAAEPAPSPAPPAVAAAPVLPAPAPPPAASDATGSFLDDSPLADPKILGVVGLLVALVVSLVSYRTIRRRRGLRNDQGFADKNGPDSFFGASGGQQVNTRDGGPSTLATSYSPSQLDAGGEVDPIAEADVYLAYGRDLQAEEILKEALRNHPERTALHAKLAEIYAKRKDVAAFHALADDAHKLTGGTGADWDRIQALGEELDPQHPLFRTAALAAAAAAAGAAGVLAAEPEPLPRSEPEPVADESSQEPSLDDIDFGFDAPEEPPAPAPIAEPEPVLELPPSLDLDFGAFTPGAAPPPPPANSGTPAAADTDSDFGLDFNLDDFESPSAPPPPPPDAEPMPSLDLSSFSLDLDDEPAPAEPRAPTPAAAASVQASAPLASDLPEVAPDDALATKLALADEFNAIGDVDGARHLIEEVIAESTGSLRERAQQMLDSLH